MPFADAQPGILAAPPPHGRFLSFRLTPEAKPLEALTSLRNAFTPDWGVLGIGAPLVLASGCRIESLRTFPALSGPACSVPATQQALWIFLQGSNRSDLFDRSEEIKSLVAAYLELEDALDTFLYAGGRDLTGYEDGTENPRDEAAIATALVAGEPGMNGSSFVAVQRWVHDLSRFRAFSADRRDGIIGRRATDNVEIEDAPASAHVKRTAQESFTPPAFMVRRSMPWSSAFEQGLEFIAYGTSTVPFEQMLHRMAGLEDGIADGLFTFSRPVTGGYYWCPPVKDGALDLRVLGV